MARITTIITGCNHSDSIDVLSRDIPRLSKLHVVINGSHQVP